MILELELVTTAVKNSHTCHLTLSLSFSIIILSP